MGCRCLLDSYLGPNLLVAIELNLPVGKDSLRLFAVLLLCLTGSCPRVTAITEGPKIEGNRRLLSRRAPGASDPPPTILHSCSKPAAMALRNEPACEAGGEGGGTSRAEEKKNTKQVV